MDIGQKLFGEAMKNMDKESLINVMENHCYDFITKPILSNYSEDEFRKSFSKSKNYKNMWFKKEFCCENPWFYTDNLRIRRTNNIFSLSYCFISDYKDSILLMDNVTARELVYYIQHFLIYDLKNITDFNAPDYYSLNYWIKCGIV